MIDVRFKEVNFTFLVYVTTIYITLPYRDASADSILRTIFSLGHRSGLNKTELSDSFIFTAQHSNTGKDEP